MRRILLSHLVSSNTLRISSVDCRMEANYAHQQEVEMLPLMMQPDCKSPAVLIVVVPGLAKQKRCSQTARAAGCKP